MMQIFGVEMYPSARSFVTPCYNLLTHEINLLFNNIALSTTFSESQNDQPVIKIILLCLSVIEISEEFDH